MSEKPEQKQKGEGIITFIPALLFYTMLFSMVTHIVTCVRSDSWWLLASGVLFVPIGMVNGIGLWFGLW